MKVYVVLHDWDAFVAVCKTRTEAEQLIKHFVEECGVDPNNYSVQECEL